MNLILEWPMLMNFLSLTQHSTGRVYLCSGQYWANFCNEILISRLQRMPSLSWKRSLPRDQAFLFYKKKRHYHIIQIWSTVNRGTLFNKHLVKSLLLEVFGFFQPLANQFLQQLWEVSAIMHILLRWEDKFKAVMSLLQSASKVHIWTQAILNAKFMH